MTERVDGFYWVRYHGGWIVAEWCTGGWEITGSERATCAADFTEIGPRIMPPEDLK